MRELGRRAGVSHSLISEVVNGNAKPSADFSIAIAQALNENPARLLRMAGFLDEPLPPAAEHEAELVQLYRRLPPEVRPVILAALRGAVGAGVPRPAPSVPQAATDKLQPLLESELPSLETQEVRWSELHRAVSRLDNERLGDLADYVLYVRWLRDRDRERGAIPEQQREAEQQAETAEN